MFAQLKKEQKKMNAMIEETVQRRAEQAKELEEQVELSNFSGRREKAAEEIGAGTGPLLMGLMEMLRLEKHLEQKKSEAVSCAMIRGGELFRKNFTEMKPWKVIEGVSEKR
ncbi:uncharacterized protein MONOS_11900 [Monocercomonoides exilis]|uniref:uncharacterized protein n=1 Tax=Monocercomonoides exilis TaxID=2049356 RepID=UPI00355A6431|nr:hypothetical protein MONOS_11900 [Monocercomonoides exilis]|eukprot:MONOS_11900.1-p1 / transcript=MONOS_11900.1 / gene=MONOS_11900 / organism=Monocercomonoides_exilis_PA203 / gene_product=unspecified product / transcript_product=unspecified product / location=Mono_scaffold00623:9032-9690(-) / protein_length=111 / sequence_SO=supercontig / SO=protein_coding / is_pseudo=false